MKKKWCRDIVNDALAKTLILPSIRVMITWWECLMLSVNDKSMCIRTLQAGEVTTKYAFTFSSPNCSAMYKPSEP